MSVEPTLAQLFSLVTLTLIGSGLVLCWTLGIDAANPGLPPGASSPAIAKTPPPTLFSQVTHTVALGTIGESNYHFGVTYVGTKQLSPTEVRFL